MRKGWHAKSRKRIEKGNCSSSREKLGKSLHVQNLYIALNQRLYVAVEVRKRELWICAKKEENLYNREEVENGQQRTAKQSRDSEKC